MSRRIGVLRGVAVGGLAFTVGCFSLAVGSRAEWCFRGLDTLGRAASAASAVSADGSVVVGTTTDASGRHTGFRWQDGVMVDLGAPSANPFAETLGAAVSADGSVVIVVAGVFPFGQVYRWEDGYTLQLYTGPWGAGYARATGVSADASVVVGWLPFKWTEGSRLLWTAARWQQTPLHPGRDLLRPDLENQQTYAYGVSSDGAVVVGEADGLGGYWPSQAFRWVGTGAVGLGTLGGPSSRAYAASADGSVIVGRADRADGIIEAFRWENDTMVGLGALGGDWPESSANAVSADGSVVVGYAFKRLADAVEYEPFIWDQDHGMRSLTELLTQHGIDLSDWHLNGAVDISADGRVIVGNGYHISLDRQEAWIATIPEPSTPAALLSLAATLLLAQLWQRRKP